jgi:NAD+ synthase (glutamine-hydrolysing)
VKLIKVGAAVLNQTPLDWEGNRRNVLDAVGRARDQGVSLLCLPELCITGHGCEDAFQSPAVQRTALEVLAGIVPETTGMAVAVGLPLMYRKALFDAVALLVDGRIAGFVGKRHLAGDGLYYEPRWFKPWPRGARGEVAVDGERYPLGDLLFEVGGVGVGFEICEDAWVASRPGSSLSARGVDVLLNPSASHFAFGKHRIRHRFVLEGSRAFGVSYVYANLLGNESGRMIFDGGAMIASGGRLLAEGPRFSFADVELTSAVVDVDQTRMLQARTSSFQPDLDRRPDDVVRLELRLPELRVPEVEAAEECGSGRSTGPAGGGRRAGDRRNGDRRIEARIAAASSGEGSAGGPAPDAAWQEGPCAKEEEFTRALALALFDYLRKSRSRGFVVSLSGGADSSAVSCLSALTFHFALRALGAEGVRRKLAYLELDAGDDPGEWIRRLLLCVYQSTRNSSTTTREAARRVAEAIGAEFLELDVDRLVGSYTAMVEDAVGRELTWQRDDLALQNVQARVRGPGVWMLANLRGALLLAASNRSEAAVGYATMDGDTCGGLSPIGGIDKAFLRRWLRWMEDTGPEGIGPIPALEAVNAQTPTAELRPPEEEQTDEGDLMPYELLDAIERAAIRDKKSPVEVYRLLHGRFPDQDRRQLATWVERFFRLWCRNQWKRERYAPSFHVDDENLDPKTWCRFPILSGGFERELAELAEYVAAEGGRGG